MRLVEHTSGNLLNTFVMSAVKHTPRVLVVPKKTQIHPKERMLACTKCGKGSEYTSSSTLKFSSAEYSLLEVEIAKDSAILVLQY